MTEDAAVPSSSMIDDLRRPGALAGETALELRETHISWVFLTERSAFKLKKPVDMGFLDFRSEEKRREACEAEVSLNRRLAPNVYHGVLPVRRTDAQGHRVGGEGVPVDWAVHMVRLPDSHRADTLLAEGRLTRDHVDRVAAVLATFHARSRCDEETSSYGNVEVIERNVRENFEQTAARIERFVSSAEAEEIERWQLEFLAARRAVFESRIAAKRVRDGHGDLRLDHVYFDDARGGLDVVDCIEFNERFRYADTCCDLAFLSMDLAWHGHVDLAERLLASYARAANDIDLYALVDFYESYRAYVRGKIAAFLAPDDASKDALIGGISSDARRYFLLALAVERRPVVPPALIAVGGLIASGKSTVAERVGMEASVPIIDADRTRKQILGIPETERIDAGAWQGAYAPEVTQQVYDEVFRRAGVVLASGRAVIVDASFRTRGFRAAARSVAQKHGAPFRFIECRAPRDVLAQRLAERERKAVVSDARVPLLDEFIARFDAVDELTAEEHRVVDSSLSVEQSLASLRDWIPTWPT